MSEYPILVSAWDEKHPADLAICECCKAEFTLDPSEGDPYDMCLTHGNTSVGKCGGRIHFKYAEVGSCANCGKLGETDVGGCCSRRCKLQADYAAQLAEGV
jgi:hypothetical protein